MHTCFAAKRGTAGKLSVIGGRSARCCFDMAAVCMVHFSVIGVAGACRAIGFGATGTAKAQGARHTSCARRLFLLRAFCCLTMH